MIKMTQKEVFFLSLKSTILVFGLILLYSNAVDIGWSLIQLIRSLFLLKVNSSQQLQVIESWLQSLEKDVIWKSWESQGITFNEIESRKIDIKTIHLPSLSSYFEQNDDIQQQQQETLTTMLWLDTLEKELNNADLSEPILIRNFHSHSNNNEFFSPLLESLQKPPLSNLTIPYFYNASQPNLLKPDAIGTLGKIVHNISHLGMPHKLGTQIPFQTFPFLIHQLIPNIYIDTNANTKPSSTSMSTSSSKSMRNILTRKFGDYFLPEHIEGNYILPGVTTVPIFLAAVTSKTTPTQSSPSHNTINNNNRPRTALHCEPIGNIAIQLSGEKRWLLIHPKYSRQLRPSISKDGRAFFYSNLNLDMDIHKTTKDNNTINNNKLDDSSTLHIIEEEAALLMNTRGIEYYQVTTQAGDALWLPPWMWHRVDYVGNNDDNDFDSSSYNNNENNMSCNVKSISQQQQHYKKVSFAASIFHFRPLEFIRNNPLFASLIVPNLIKELIGTNTE